MSQAGMEMPRYRCHKEVWALKLCSITRDEMTKDWALVPADNRYAPIMVSGTWIAMRCPSRGEGDYGYYVKYDDGYDSWSPTKAFEEGYTLLTPPSSQDSGPSPSA